LHCLGTGPQPVPNQTTLTTEGACIDSLGSLSKTKIYIEVGEPMMLALREQARLEGRTLGEIGRSALVQYLKAAKTATVG
jgi:hypothetical protein